VQVTADRAHDHLARVQANANLHIQPLAPPQLFAIAPHRFLHAQRRIAGPHRVVLVGNRRAEEGHNPVAHDLVHRPLIAVHGGHHPLQHRVEELPRLLGVAVGQQLHRALQVGEQDGHLLAFAFQGSAGGEHLLGEVRGCVGEWRTRLRLGTFLGWR
jgi:hypothetical protein